MTRIGDVESLTGKILFLYENPAVCSAMGEKARAVMERDFERTSITGKFQTLIKSLVSGQEEIPEIKETTIVLEEHAK